MARATTAASGAPSPGTGSSARPSPPTGRRTASASSRKRRAARTRRLFAFDRSLESRFVAGADEAGRGSLAGPLVAAGVLIDYQGLGLADRRALTGLHDSKQMTEELRETLYPRVLRAAARVSVVFRCVRGIDSRGLHVTNIEALSAALVALDAERRDPPGRRLPPAALPAPAPAGDRGRRDERRNRRRLGDRQGEPRPLHEAPRRRASRLGIRRERRLLDARSTARRSPRSAYPHSTGAPSSRSPTASSSWPAELSPGAADVLVGGAASHRRRR